MGSTSSDHATTFLCLDRVIVASGGNLSFLFGGDFDPLLIGVEEFRVRLLSAMRLLRQCNLST